MKETGRIVILLFALASAGCVQRDWTGTLTLVDVTGSWAGTFLFKGGTCEVLPGCERHISLVLRQRGARVTGAVIGSSVYFGGDTIDGVIDGEQFTFTLGALRGEASVSGDDMAGKALGGFSGGRCPCIISLRRASPADTMQETR